MEKFSVGGTKRRYLPAASLDVFLPVYDFVARVLGADRARQAMLDQVSLRPGDRALDIGCGTGTFLIMLKKRYPAVDLVGLDPDGKALARARGKAERARLAINFDEGFADTLAYSSRTFAAVFSSFMFHHLEAENREATLKEVRRVLKPGGLFYLLDFEVSSSRSRHGLFNLVHSSQRLRDNSESRILELVGRAGFSQVKKIAVIALIAGFGQAACYRATAPS